MILICLIIAIVIIICIYIIHIQNSTEDEEEDYNLSMTIYNNWINKIREEERGKHIHILEKISGENEGENPCKTITFISNIDYALTEEWKSTYISAFEKAQILVVNNIVLKFNEISNFEIIDNATKEIIQFTSGSSSQNLSDIVSRSIIGSIFAGEDGALIGALTSSHDISMTSTNKETIKHDYVINVYTNSIQRSIIRINLLDDQKAAYEVISIINAIINQ